jgi:hypothetical protein
MDKIPYHAQPRFFSIAQLQANGCSAGNRVERALQGGVRARSRIPRRQHAGAALLQRAFATVTTMQILQQLCGEQQTVGVSMLHNV